MRRSLQIVAAAAFLAASCTPGDEPRPAPATREVDPALIEGELPVPDLSEGAPTTVAGSAAVGSGITWTELGERVDEGTLTVPLDYGDPSGDSIDLHIVRHRAAPDARIGILFVNNGGPGSPASSMGLNATAWFQPEITDRFDVIAWDPRGTGRSGGSVDCIDDDEYDRFFAVPDVTPETEEEKDELIELAREFAQRCIDRVGPALGFIGTNNSARDIDAMREALGEPQASFFGFSYGSELGATWATLFPATVRAAVLDGASDPNAGPLEHTRQQWVGFEAALNAFLLECSNDSSCAFHNDGDAAGAFDELFRSLDEDPLSTTGGRAPVNLGVGITGVVRSLYSDQFWPALERALEDAQAGDGDGLLRLRDAYYQRSADGSYSNLLESFEAISCADIEERLTVEEADEQAEELLDVAPRLFPYTTGSYTCTFFPEAIDPRIDITGAGAGPIVVIGTTGDPSTPLDSSRAMADALEDGRLVIVEANQHTGYRVNRCVDDLIHEYLEQLTAPDDETLCD